MYGSITFGTRTYGGQIPFGYAAVLPTPPLRGVHFDLQTLQVAGLSEQVLDTSPARLDLQGLEAAGLSTITVGTATLEYRSLVSLHLTDMEFVVIV